MMFPATQQSFAISETAAKITLVEIGNAVYGLRTVDLQDPYILCNRHGTSSGLNKLRSFDSIPLGSAVTPIMDPFLTHFITGNISSHPSSTSNPDMCRRAIYPKKFSIITSLGREILSSYEEFDRNTLTEQQISAIDQAIPLKFTLEVGNHRAIISHDFKRSDGSLNGLVRASVLRRLAITDEERALIDNLMKAEPKLSASDYQTLTFLANRRELELKLNREIDFSDISPASFSEVKVTRKTEQDLKIRIGYTNKPIRSYDRVHFTCDDLEVGGICVLNNADYSAILQEAVPAQRISEDLLGIRYQEGDELCNPGGFHFYYTVQDENILRATYLGAYSGYGILPISPDKSALICLEKSDLTSESFYLSIYNLTADATDPKRLGQFVEQNF